MDPVKSTKQESLRRAFQVYANRRRTGDVIFDAVNKILITIICLVMLYPFLYVISVSLSSYDKVVDVILLPKGFNVMAYIYVFAIKNIQTGYINSAVYTITGVLLSMTMTILCAYPLSKKWLPGRKYISIFVVITMYFSGGLIPVYLLVSELKMIDTIWSIILPGALGTYYMIMTRTYFNSSIPVELEESCFIDGANEFQTLWHVYLPLSKPIIATISLFYLVNMWNSWFPASIYLSSESKYPIQLILRNAMSTNGSAFLGGSTAVGELMKGSNVNYHSLNYALTIAVVLPIVFIYPFAQRYFIKGMMVGSLKG